MILSGKDGFAIAMRVPTALVLRWLVYRRVIEGQSLPRFIIVPAKLLLFTPFLATLGVLGGCAGLDQLPVAQLTEGANVAPR
jgi:hypothetical protein